MVDYVRERLPAVIEVCRANGVQRLWLFGSATGRGTRPFSQRSDVDLLVEFDPDADLPRGWSHPLFSLDEVLRPVLGRRVHVTEMAEFRNPYFRKAVEASKELLYDGRDEKVAH